MTLKKGKGHTGGLTLAEYAEAKMLDEAFLLKLGLADTKLGGQPAVRIPYRDIGGNESAVRFQLRLNGANQRRWKKDSKPRLFGLWRVKEMRRAGYIVLPVAELNALTLWQHGFPAMGLPDADSWQESWDKDLADFPKIYIPIDCGKEGEAIWSWLAKSSIRQRVYLVFLQGAHDPSELHMKDPAKLRDTFQEALAAAVPWADEGSNLVVAPGHRRSRSTDLVGLLNGAELFHTPDSEPYVSVKVNNHWETMRLRDRTFRRWFARQFYQEFRRVPSSQVITDAMSVIEGQALYEGQQLEIHIRVAEQGGSIFLDLANESWEGVQISAEGWRVIERPTVKFRRPKGMLALPRPVNGGTVDELRPFVNVASQDEWVLMVSWLVQALRPSGPFPVLVIQGEQGSAKSTVAKIARALVDPNSCPLRSEPRELRDLMIAASNGWCVGFDNVSTMSPRLADAICRLSTGSGFSARQLFTDEEEKLFTATRPVLLNGIDGLVVRGDLQDRSILSYLPTIPENRRQAEQEFWQGFERVRPRVLGALLDGASTALRRLPHIQLSSLPRMADFAKWATAARKSFGWDRG